MQVKTPKKFQTPCVYCTAEFCHRSRPASQSSGAQISHILFSSFHWQTIVLLLKISQQIYPSTWHQIIRYDTHHWHKPSVTVARLYHTMWLLAFQQFTPKLHSHNLWLHISIANTFEKLIDFPLEVWQRYLIQENPYLAHLAVGRILHPVLFLL